MIDITAGSANELFALACHALLNTGTKVSPRSMPTIETMGAHLHLTDPRRRLVDLAPTRVINPAFAVAETMWILSGSDDPWIFDYNRNLLRYTDDGRLQGAYGPRMRRWGGRIDQLAGVRDILTRDRDSRQAVIQLYDPARDTRGHRDVPCTLNYRFFVRENRLDMHTTMRSQDLWLGFPYDVFAATTLHELMAGWLGVELGDYHHHLDSLHLYDSHLALARTVDQHSSASAAMEPIHVEWDRFDAVLDDVVRGRPPSTHCPVWEEFSAVMDSYARWRAGDRPGAIARAGVVPNVLGAALERWYERLSFSVEADMAIGVPQ
ncbi:thymidylate synthase [Nocardia takedensis]|uniref:thymidylate synthase n=1 Tax=Nocardia takedensis TaxID=259390 RepID=UPI0002ECB9A3|nr:thymidylate synthase [Nocardia takedensis]